MIQSNTQSDIQDNNLLVSEYSDPRRLKELNKTFEGAHPDRILSWGYETFGSKVALGTGFGPSGLFLIHRIHKLGLEIPIFYLDTHLLFEETYELSDKIEELLGISITRVNPSLSLEEQSELYGDELWKKNPDKCCYLRKVKPLQKYLSDKSGWITGIRRNQSVTRQDAGIVEYDSVSDVVKLNPLVEWDGDRVWDYIHEHNLPYNPLHDDGFPSIGCIPCTSRVSDNEDERNGRWRGSDKMECGIHFSESTGSFEPVSQGSK
jgi:phosphoadenosine phosphosulfate reductase